MLVNTEDRDIGSVAADISKRLKGLEMPKGMKAELRGEYARMKESFDSLAVGLALASVLVYLLMVPLLRSFVMPLIIMVTVPLGLIGVLVTLVGDGHDAERAVRDGRDLPGRHRRLAGRAADGLRQPAAQAGADGPRGDHAGGGRSGSGRS